MAEEAALSRRVKRAAQMLLLQRYRSLGVKGWELRRSLGKDYTQIIEILKVEFGRLGLEVKVVFEEGDEVKEPTQDQLDRARFFAVFKTPLLYGDLEAIGWRVDDVSALAATLAYIVSRRGKASRKDVEQLLREKFPKWRVEFNLDRFIRRGYLSQDKDDILYVGWRTRAEVDQKTLLSLILASETPSEMK